MKIIPYISNCLCSIETHVTSINDDLLTYLLTFMGLHIYKFVEYEQ